MVGNAFINISPSNINLYILLPVRFHQDCQAVVGCCSRVILYLKCLIAAATYWRENKLFTSACACDSTWFKQLGASSIFILLTKELFPYLSDI